MSLKVLRQKHADLARESQALFDKAAADKRPLTDDEKKRDDAIAGEMETVAGDLARAERNLERQRGLAPAEDGNAVVVDAAARAAAAEPRFKTFGEQLVAVYNAAHGTGDRRLVAAASGASEGVPSDGGFLVQTDFSGEIIKRVYEMGAIASRIRKIGISGNANGLKINGIDETSRANGSRWGGVRAYWAAEADTVTATRPKFRQLELNLKKLFGLFYSTDELLADASALESVARQAMAEEFTFKLEDAAIRGTGAGMPLGILNAPCMLSVAKETGQLANTIVIENIVKMWARMWGRSRLSAVWLINQDIEPQLYTMGQTVGTGGQPVYLPPGGLSAQPYATLMGRPIIPVEYCPTLGATGDIMLTDWSQYLAIDKDGVRQDVSIHVRFLQDEQVFRFIYRYDGQPTWNAALTPFQGTNTQSPFVRLDTRA